MDAVEPAAKALDDLFARPFEADDPDIGLEVDGLFDVRKVERRDIAHELGRPTTEKALQAFRDAGRSRTVTPGQPWSLLVGDVRAGLLIEHVGQGMSAATARAGSENQFRKYGAELD